MTTPQDLRSLGRKAAIYALVVVSVAFGWMWGHWFS